MEEFVRWNILSPYFPILREQYPYLPERVDASREYTDPTIALKILEEHEEFANPVCYRLERIGIVFPYWFADLPLVKYLVERGVASVDYSQPESFVKN